MKTGNYDEASRLYDELAEWVGDEPVASMTDPRAPYHDAAQKAERARQLVAQWDKNTDEKPVTPPPSTPPAPTADKGLEKVMDKMRASASPPPTLSPEAAEAVVKMKARELAKEYIKELRKESEQEPPPACPLASPALYFLAGAGWMLALCLILFMVLQRRRLKGS